MLIDINTVVSLHYTLSNFNGEVLDSSSGQEPLSYLHGAENIVPGLENALTGKSAGDHFDVSITPEDGYGEIREDLIQTVDRSHFDGVDNIEVGMQFMAQTPWGEQPVVVKDIEGDNITLDGNHPLAGQTLHFDIEVINIREASSEEVAAGYPQE